VDQDICQGNGVCAYRSPDVFKLGDDEIAEVTDETVADDRYSEMTRTAASCPTQAITVEKS
jgi:ferredoxin